MPCSSSVLSCRGFPLVGFPQWLVDLTGDPQLVHHYRQFSGDGQRRVKGWHTPRTIGEAVTMVSGAKDPARSESANRSAGADRGRQRDAADSVNRRACGPVVFTLLGVLNLFAYLPRFHSALSQLPNPRDLQLAVGG